MKIALENSCQTGIEGSDQDLFPSNTEKNKATKKGR